MVQPLTRCKFVLPISQFKTLFLHLIEQNIKRYQICMRDKVGSLCKTLLDYQDILYSIAKVIPCRVWTEALQSIFLNCFHYHCYSVKNVWTLEMRGVAASHVEVAPRYTEQETVCRNWPMFIRSAEPCPA